MTRDEFSDTHASSESDRHYFLTRAQWHETRADLALDTATRSPHQRFATLYHARSLT